jgi:hypothetical protein
MQHYALCNKGPEARITCDIGEAPEEVRVGLSLKKINREYVHRKRRAGEE